MSRQIIATSLLLLLAGCSKGTSTLSLTLSAKSMIGPIEHFAVTATEHTQAGAAHQLTLRPTTPPVELPPAQTFQLQFGADVSGPLHLAIDAVGTSGQTLASASGDATLKPSATSQMTIEFGDDSGSDGGMVASKPSIDFGAINVGGMSGAASVVITNQGKSNSGALSVTIGGSSSSAFAIDADSCKGSDLAPRSSCTVTLHLSPSSADAVSGALVIAGAHDSVTVTLTGSAVPRGSFTITPASKMFPGVLVGSSSNDVTFTVSYNAATPSGSPSVKLSGSDAKAFVMSSNTCTTALTSTTTCAVKVHFAPSAVGSSNASLTVSATPGGLNTAALSGTGLGPAQIVAVTSSPQPFGSVPKGTASAQLTLSFSNMGGVASGAVMLSSSAPSEFVIDSDSCNNLPLLPGNSCSAKVHFSPAALGDRSATLTANAGTSGGTATITLAGTGLPPAVLQMSPTSNNFDPQDVKTMSPPITFTVSNPGTTMAGAITSSITGSTSDFTITDNCQGKMLAPNGGMCSYVVVFAPATYGDKSLSITATASPGGAVVAQASGTGRDKLTLTLGNSGGGSVTSNPPGLNCSGDGTCTYSFYRDTQVTLTASPEARVARIGTAGVATAPAPSP
jgi:hypothetical protein